MNALASMADGAVSVLTQHEGADDGAEAVAIFLSELTDRVKLELQAGNLEDAGTLLRSVQVDVGRLGVALRLAKALRDLGWARVSCPEHLVYFEARVMRLQNELREVRHGH